MAASAADALAYLFIAIVFAPFSALYVADYVAAVRRGDGVITLSDDLQRLREWWRAESTDDAPVWAEVLGMLLAGGLLFRAACHVFVARLHDLDGELAETDLSAANAVAAIRDGDERRADFNGRVAAFLVGVVLWWTYVPGQGPSLSIEAGHALAGVVQAYVTLNIAVLFADGIAFIGVLNRSLNTTTETTNGA